MRRSQLQEKKNSFLGDISKAASERPLSYLGAALGLGVVLGLFARVAIPMAIILGSIAGVVWFLSEPDGPVNFDDQ